MKTFVKSFLNKMHSIKFKIIFLYTFILMIVFILIMAGIFFSSEKFGEENMKTELQDEVRDLEQDILRFPESFPKGSAMAFYDDGVMLSLYDANGQLLSGVLPDEIALQESFSENRIQTIRGEEESWFLCDRKVELTDGTVYWIRGIYSYSSLVLMIRQITSLMCWIFPFLILITVIIAYRMIRHSLSQIPVITGAVRDITESSTLETRLELPAARDEFYELTDTFNQMLESLEDTFKREKQFSSDAAHELRTPISSILSHCEYCLEDLNPPENVRSELELIHQKATQMSQLVSQLLMISRAEQHKSIPVFEDVDLLMVIESVCDELEDKAKTRGISISIDSFSEEPVIEADLSLITRLFINLVSNAIKYGKPQGKVIISLSSSNNGIRVDVADDGIGISYEDQKRIWDRFYRADSSRSLTEGFGLGLFMVKYIIEQHKGTIEVSSAPQRGSTFTVWLPIHQPKET